MVQARKSRMRRRLPPLHNFEAFIVAASSPSFRVAAESLALSPAALSRRIQSLSEYAGVKLFERCVGGARLTEAGRKCLSDIEPAYLELLRAATSIAPREGRGREVQLSLSHSLAVGWLIPRLNRFRTAHPEIELSFKTQRGASDLRRGDVDLAICFADIDLSGLDVHPLLEVFCTPVASPTIAQRYRAEGRPLGQHRLLAVASPPDSWSRWSQSTGIHLDCEAFIRFDMLHAMYESASQGIGIAMGSSATVWPHLESGRLESLGLPVARYGDGYRLATNANCRLQPPIATVWHWLKAEAARTPHLIDAPGAFRSDRQRSSNHLQFADTAD